MRCATRLVARVALLTTLLAGCSPSAPVAPATGTGDTAYPRLTPACPRTQPTGKPPVVTVAQLNIVSGSPIRSRVGELFRQLSKLFFERMDAAFNLFG